MIKINLLPDAYKQQSKPGKQKIPITLILLSANALLLALLLVVTAVNVYRTISLKALKTRLVTLASEQQKIATIKQRIENFKTTNALFAPLVKREFLWSKTLNKLSDLLIPGVWFRSLSMERKIVNKTENFVTADVTIKYLVLMGTAVSVGEDEMAIIGEFIRKLKSDTDFIKHFENIELESVLRRKIAAVEVMDFTLTCYFKREI